MIRKKLQLMIAIALIGALAMALISHLALRGVHDSGEQKITMTLFLRNQMQADMMHYAVRGDVVLSLYEAGRYNAKGIKEASESLDEHAKTFIEFFDKNMQLPVHQELKDEALKIRPLVEEYLTGGKDVITQAASDPILADRHLAGFLEKFEALEEGMGALNEKAEEITLNLDGAAIETFDKWERMLIFATIIMLVCIGAMALQIFSRLLNPLQNIVQNMIQLSQGNMEVDISGAERKDEIGSMLRAMSVFKDNAQKTRNMEQERAASEARAQDEKKQAMRELAQRFEQRVQGIIASVASASTQLLQTAQSMSDVIGEANHKAESVARSADATTGNVQTVASAAEEMTASVKEISSQVNKSTQVVADTVSKAEHADSSAKELEGAAQQIGHVVQLIQDIAEQINLLALNATIESARAGDAGKGFAVVASEVKNLATQTTKATEEIASQIEGIQIISKSVVEALNGIKLSIDHVSEYAGGIASAVEEQSAVTDEIAANMQTAAAGTNDIRVNINDVTSKATSAKMAASSVLEASRSLSREAETLSREVAEFLSEIRG